MKMNDCTTEQSSNHNENQQILGIPGYRFRYSQINSVGTPGSDKRSANHSHNNEYAL